jgi:dimethylargininase
MNNCQLAFVERQPIDIAQAIAQHDLYEACLASLGIAVVSLPAVPDQPDAVFVEDPAIVLDEVAIMTLEGGDVVRIGSTLFVGRSARSNDVGIAQLARELAPLGYAVQAVGMRGCLHLKSACTYLGRDTVLANRDWADLAPFAGARVIDVAPGEPAAADVLAIGDTVIVPASFPETARTLDRAGWRVLAIDVSELQKAEAGVTCMSLIFNGSPIVAGTAAFTGSDLTCREYGSTARKNR